MDTIIVSMEEIMDTKDRVERGRAGRRTRSTRKSYTLEQKRQIVDETLLPGASVSRVARAHDLNTNLLFTWRRQYARGELTAAQEVCSSVAMVPVRMQPTSEERGGTQVLPVARVVPQPGLIEIALGEATVRVHGGADLDALSRIVAMLRRP